MGDLVPVVVIDVGPLVLAVRADGVEGVVLLESLASVPLARGAVAGICAVAGEPVLVLDLARVFEIDRANGEAGRCAVVCSTRAARVALVGLRIRWVGRARVAEPISPAPCARDAVEWRGQVLPLVEAELVLEAARSGLAATT